MPSLTKVQSGFVEAQGALPLSSGTAAAPGLKFDDHAGTGMFSPSTGEIAFSTSGHSQAVTFKTDGNVGIGYNSPTVRLHIRESASGVSSYDNRYHCIIEDDAEAYYGVYVPNSGYGGLRVIDGSGNIGSRLDYYVNENQMHYQCVGDHIFSTTGNVERLRITSAGSVGIGLINPESYGNFADDFVIYNASQPGMTLASGTSGYGSIYFADGTAGNTLSRGQIQYGHSDDFMQFSTAATERLRITSAGNIGINNTSPESYASDGRNLVIGNSSSNAASGITLVSGTGGYSQLYFADGTSGSALYSGTITYNHSDNRMDFWTNGVRRLRIDSAGRLMSGTTTEGESNADDLTVATSGHTGMTIRSGTANRGNIYFSDGTSGDAEYRGYITYDHDGDKLKLGTANADRLLITSAGDIGIGQTNPQGDLHIGNISGNKDLIMHSANNGNARVRFREGGNTASGFNEYSIGMVGASNAMTINGQGAGEIIRIMGDTGNIGVNQTSVNATRKMEITQPSSYTSGLRINSAGSAGNGAYVEFFVGTANYKIGGDHNSNNLKFRKDGTELLRLTSDGHLSLVGDNQKLLIGAGDDLQLYHDGNNSFIKDVGTGRLTIATSQLQLTNAADSAVMIRATQSGTVELFHNGTKRLETTNLGVKITSNLYLGGSLNGGFSYNSTANTLEFLMTNGGTHSELTSNAYVPSATATRHLGYHNKRWDKLFCDGVRFDGNNTDLTTLDDYEEGSWNPTVVGGSYSVGRAWYVKVGRKVTIFINVGLSSATSSAFTVTLPFVGKTTGYTGTSQGVEAHGSCMLYGANMPSSTYNVCVYCWNNHASLYASRTNLAWRQLLGNEVGSSIQFTAHYVVLA